MGSSMDALSAPSSLTQRRQAASNLPNFELPPPSNLQFAPVSHHKYPPFSSSNHPATAAVSVGNLLTPPSNSTSDGSASSSNGPTGSTPNGVSGQVLPYTPTFFNTGSTPGYHTGFTPQPWQNSNPLFPPRSMFSPMPAPLMRNNTNSPTAHENSQLPPPTYDIHSVPSFSNGLSLASPTGASLSAQQHVMGNSHMQSGNRPSSQQSPISPADGNSRPSSTPTLYTNIHQQQQQQQQQQHHHTGYPYSNPTPMSQSPHSANPNGQRRSPPINQNPISQQQSQNHFIRPPYPSYSLPAMPGPALTNANSPGGQMSLVNAMPGGMLPMGYNSGYAANPQNVYGQPRTNSPQQPATNDRPFKCDQCPSSFNRNHDLKRHKRIHLAVKPFPCNHCDKSFSRKDALKRHILVKGCGNRGSSDSLTREDGMKSESGSDEVSDSPVISGA